MRHDLNFLLSTLTGNTNVNMYDDLGIPSTMVRIPKFNISDVIAGGPDTPHPMFIVDGEVKNEIFIGKYMASLFKDRAYSLPNKIPANNLSFRKAREVCFDFPEYIYRPKSKVYQFLSKFTCTQKYE